jgi:hypothetical protein
MDWILSHNTLEQLVLKDCLITHYMRFPKVLDEEGHAALFLDTDDIPVYMNKLRWLQVFQQMETRLPRLMVSRFASESVANFKDGRILERGLYLHRFMAFTRAWIDWAHRDAIKDPRCVWPQNGGEIEIGEEMAYRHLMTVAKARGEQWLMSRQL